MPTHLPKILQDIADQLAPIPPATVDCYAPVQKAFIQSVQELNGLQLHADGIAQLGDLSPGCQACREGTWDCVFVTLQCNLNCDFCCNPTAIPSDYHGSAFGDTPLQIIQNQRKTTITGVSFSGGDPFMESDRLFDWVAQFRRHQPDKYTWLYTNGLLLNEDRIKRLADVTINEIRFNLAASHYTHAKVLQSLELAAKYIPNLTVEIPAIPGHAEKLLSSLPVWVDGGVRFLNLHELMHEPGTNAAAMSGQRQPIILPDGHETIINPQSRLLIARVMRTVIEQKLSLSVNDCSLPSKLRQVRGRRKSLVPFTQHPSEKRIDGVFYEKYGHSSDDRVAFFHPDALDPMREKFPDDRFFRLVRTMPLAIGDGGRWVVMEELKMQE